MARLRDAHGQSENNHAHAGAVFVSLLGSVFEQILWPCSACSARVAFGTSFIGILYEGRLAGGALHYTQTGPCSMGHQIPLQ